MLKGRLSAISVMLLGGVMAQSAYAQTSGGDFFKQRCAMCHTTASGGRAGIGPNLAGIVGRQAGSTTYTYSAALKKAAIKWDKATLDAFLTAPGKVVPGTRMVVQVSDPAQRAKLIAYLATLK